MVCNPKKSGQKCLYKYLFKESLQCYKYELLTKCDVKMAGHWPSSFFFCVFMDRDRVEVHNLAKIEQGQYPAILTKQAWSIKDLLYGFWGNFFVGHGR